MKGDSGIKMVRFVEPDEYSAAAEQDGTGVDCKGYDEAMILFDLGTFASGGTVQMTVQESDDDSTYTDVSGATVTNYTESNDAAQYVGKLDLSGLKRYIRVQYDVDTAACTFGVSGILYAAGNEPVSQTNTLEFDV